MLPPLECAKKAVKAMIAIQQCRPSICG